MTLTSEAGVLNPEACGVQGYSPDEGCGGPLPFFFFSSHMDKFMDNFFFKSGQIHMKDAECVETNEKSIFRFSVFEIRPFLYSKLFNF